MPKKLCKQMDSLSQMSAQGQIAHNLQRQLTKLGRSQKLVSTKAASQHAALSVDRSSSLNLSKRTFHLVVLAFDL